MSPKLIICTALVSSILLITACSQPADNTQTNAPAPPPAASPAATTPSATSSAKAKLNVNTASGADFQREIPNLGNRMVHEFEEYRPYNSIQQFRKEIGKYVDQNQVAEYEKYIYVPIDENKGDAATLQQIPGLDANEVQQLIAARPFASHDAFLQKLATMISADELAIAKTYLVQQ